MNTQSVINEVSEYVKSKQSGESSGHDWWHTYRVVKTAKYLALEEGADSFIVELAALLHDIADWKFENGNDKVGSQVSRKILKKYKLDKKLVDHICHIVDSVSFKGSSHDNQIDTIEGMVVQDADRLDALGAIGIARTFAYGGSQGRDIYNPDVKYEKEMDFEKYKNNKSSGINHFYEKLLLLKDLMNTNTAKKIAQDRHVFMEAYLDEFYKEWEAEY